MNYLRFWPRGKARRPAGTSYSTPCSTPATTSPRAPTCARRSSVCADCCPPGALSVSKDGRVGLSPDVVLASDSARLEQELAAAARLQGSELIAATEQALEPLARGEYLAGVRSAWVDERRQQLAELATRARAAAADAAYAVDRYPDAQRLAEAVLAADPLREATWRALMRIRGAVGDYDGIISTFAQCERALRAAGIAPAASTRTLLDQLRR